jgi:hypothetical protein
MSGGALDQVPLTQRTTVEDTYGLVALELAPPTCLLMFTLQSLQILALYFMAVFFMGAKLSGRTLFDIPGNRIFCCLSFLLRKEKFSGYCRKLNSSGLIYN